MTFMAHEAASLSPGAIESARLRTRWALSISVALGSTGHLAAATVASIVGEDLLGNASLAGAPGATVVFGAAVGAIGLSAIMVRRGRRFGLTLGYLVSVVGALIAAYAVVSRSFPLLLLGTFAIGAGNASNNLSRYVAADLVGPSRRAVAIGLVVWGSTVGGVLGPALVPIGQAIAPTFGLPELAGPYLIPVVIVGAAALVTFLLLRPDPFAIAHESTIHVPGDAPPVSVREILLRPAVLAAVAALIAGQATMVLIMTMTPLHLTHHGHGLGTVGVVISGHVFGMFALAPVSGWITPPDRPAPDDLPGHRGPHRVVAAGGAGAAGEQRDPVRRAVPARLGLEPRLRGRKRAAVVGRGARRAGACPGCRRRGHLDDLGGRQPRVRRRRGRSRASRRSGLIGVAIVLAPIWLLIQGRRSLAAGA